jgi:hypothetical protein
VAIIVAGPQFSENLDLPLTITIKKHQYYCNTDGFFLIVIIVVVT